MHAEYLCPTLTALTSDGVVDFESQHRLYDRLIEAGIDGAIVLGSSGEFYAMTLDECCELGLDAIRHIAGRMKVYVGCGRLKMDETVELSNRMLDAGATGVIVVGPYYIGASEEGIFSYYDEVASRVHGNILIYNYPERTGYDVTPAIINRLLERHGNIVGIKDTVESATHTQAIVKGVKAEHPDFLVYSGFDNNLVPTVFAGGNGVIAAISNMAPELCASWIRAFKADDLKETARIHAEICRLMDIYRITTPFMPGMKKVLEFQGMGFTDRSLAPAVTCDDAAAAAAERIASILKEESHV